MLVNHVTEKTDPRKFASQRIRQQVVAIQDPDRQKLQAAEMAIRSAKGYDEFVDTSLNYRNLEENLKNGWA